MDDNPNFSFIWREFCEEEGHRVLQQLRSMSETRAVPIILMTATAKVIHDLAEKEGARMLSKSVDTQVVMRRIREALYPEGMQPANVAPAESFSAAPEPTEPLYQIVHDRFVDFVPQRTVVPPWNPPSKP